MRKMLGILHNNNYGEYMWRDSNHRPNLLTPLSRSLQVPPTETLRFINCIWLSTKTGNKNPNTRQNPDTKTILSKTESLIYYPIKNFDLKKPAHPQFFFGDSPPSILYPTKWTEEDRITSHVHMIILQNFWRSHAYTSHDNPKQI